MENNKEIKNKDESKVLKVEELDGVSGGGGIDTGCEHEWEFIRRDKGVIWGYNNIYECKRCGEIWIEWDD
jgi:hypothetical protein